MHWAEHYKKKVIDPELLPKKIIDWRKDGKTIATLNGSFDLMHAGHLHIIFEASKQADLLIMALNTDKSIQAYKNADRPIITLEYRLQMIAAIEFVDYVTWFDETNPIPILKVIKPDVHVNGAEYGLNCIESCTVSMYGGRLHLVDRIPGLATSEVINKIRQLS